MTAGWTTEIYGLLPHTYANQIFMVPGRTGWSLPKSQIEGRPLLEPHLATQKMRQVLGLPLIAYRYAQITSNEEDKRQECIFALDALGEISQLSNTGMWVGRAELSRLHLTDPDHYDVVDDYLRERETGIISEFRQPWEQRGWYARASVWIEEQLALQGRELLAPPEQVRWWSLSAVLRGPTTDGDVYFKASARQPLFANEGPLLNYLGKICPGRVPEVMASEPDSGWMLLQEAGVTHRGSVPIDQKTAILTAFGHIQRTTVPHVDQLQELGCADRRAHTLIHQIEPLLQDELAVAALAPEEVSELRQRVPEMIELCQRISDYSVPLTLIHGDLHAGNVASVDDQLVFFDWTEACIAHPFMDAFMIYNERDEDVHNRMRDAYLPGWSSFESIERLRELWSLCAVVRALHHAVSYLTILRHTEVRSRRELAGTLPFLLREALWYLHKPA